MISAFPTPPAARIAKGNDCFTGSHAEEAFRPDSMHRARTAKDRISTWGYGAFPMLLSTPARSPEVGQTDPAPLPWTSGRIGMAMMLGCDPSEGGTWRISNVWMAQRGWAWIPRDPFPNGEELADFRGRQMQVGLPEVTGPKFGDPMLAHLVPYMAKQLAESVMR